MSRISFSQHRPRFPSAACALLLASGFAALGCDPKEEQPDADAIAIGALLPFTGKEAAIGRNLEQAMLLAIEDVNQAGGVGGRKLRLISRDSNSGSERGLEELLQLLYTDQVQYLVGPEENELANAIVSDIKGLDILNILPGYAAPPIEHVSTKGSWIRLAPSPAALGCGMAANAIADGARTANAIVSQDDFNGNLAADFAAQFDRLGGKLLPSVPVIAGANSYSRKITQAFNYGADQTLLIAYPTTASTIATEWTINSHKGSWYLSPMLHAEVFLLNTPFGALNGFRGLSPSQSLLSECTAGDTAEQVVCTHDNADNFGRHFADYWDGDEALPAARFYYDAVALLALGLERGFGEQGKLPSTRVLRDDIRDLGTQSGSSIFWWDLSSALQDVTKAREVSYVGAAAEYNFDRYGAAQHVIFDTWSIQNDSFIDTGALKAECPVTY